MCMRGRAEAAGADGAEEGEDAFMKTFGLDWDKAVAGGQVYNATEACAKLGLDGAGLGRRVGAGRRGFDLLKFGGGFYCGKVKGIYVMNGFYMAMRGAYTEPGKKIYWFTLDFPEDKLSWADFRGKVLGATNPRRRGGGLGAPPDPRGLAGPRPRRAPRHRRQRRARVGLAVRGSRRAAQLARRDGRGRHVRRGAASPPGVAQGDAVVDWTTDPVVAGGSLFDALEDLDRTECLKKAVTLVGK